MLAQDRGPLREIALRYAASLEPVIGDTYRDFLLAIDPTVAIDVLLPRGDRAAWDAFARRVTPGLAERARFVAVDGGLDAGPVDGALVLAPDAPSRRTVLGVPRPSEARGANALAAAMPDRFEVRAIPFAFSDTHVAVTPEGVIVDARAWPHGRDGASIFGRPAVVLGDAANDVPPAPLATYVAPLAGQRGRTVLVGDAAMARALLPARWALKGASVAPLVPDFSDASVARFDRAAADLAAAGFDVVRIPAVPFDARTTITYTGGIFETRGGIGLAYVPSYGIEATDAAARRVYERLGWKIVPVRASAAGPHLGALAAWIAVLARS